MLDVKPIVALAHERGVPVLLDSYQAIGSLPIDVKALGVDFLAAGVLKYLLGSAGLGFLYCRRELWESAWPTATGWFADRNVFEMDIHDYSPAPDARRFQSGTPPVPSIYAGIAGIELMQEIGIAATRKHVRRLTELLIEGVDDLGGIVATPREPERARRARLHQVDRRRASRHGARRRGNRHVVARREPARLAARVQHAGGHQDRALGAGPSPEFARA